MMKIIIDNTEYIVENGITVLEAIYSIGLELPHFCWHPALSISGNCRMCLVEIGLPKVNSDKTYVFDENGKYLVNYNPKLQIACATPIQELMHINTNSTKVLKSRRAVMEFLLINHPLDCPICDEAGECKLQEYAYLHSEGKSRFDEEKQSKPKKVKWSENIIYDGERCIMCSRCIRFAKEVANQDVLTFVKRGDRINIEVEKGKSFDNPLSMNVIDLCPVGALTSNNFRFKSRVWEMTFADTISPFDNIGSNLHVGMKKNEILRISPNTNPKANAYWISDKTRLAHILHNSNRLNSPLHNNAIVTYEEILDAFVHNIKYYKPEEILFILSPNSSTETIFVISKYANEVMNCTNLVYYLNPDEEENVPNQKALELLNIKTHFNDFDKLKDIKAVVSVENDINSTYSITNRIENIDLFINISHYLSEIKAKTILQIPSANSFESEGTFINKDSLIQHFKQIISTKQYRPNLEYSRWERFGADNDKWAKKNIKDVLPAWLFITNLTKKIGIEWKYSTANDIFIDFANLIGKDVDYSLIDTLQGYSIIKNNIENKNIYKSNHFKP